ncbi:hypothetical protein BCR39DRAFT_511533 [Naematelia encephala]|uniref:Transmembrane protein n=1 Tax=Naematelia encephala TaxID=71784 RepID=A0A1Y2BLP2_9TREE|nr:hypothetical protein BCR39DRAFT_511533 [Naematelia encephala]
MFTPLSKGSERAQDNVWDRTASPRKNRARPSLNPTPTKPARTPQSTGFGKPRPPPLSHTRSGSGIGSGDVGVGGIGVGIGGGGHTRQISRSMRAARRASLIEEEKDVGWIGMFFRPRRKDVDRWLSSFWTRHFVLILLPCLAVWIWVAIPFPVIDPYTDDPFPEIPSWPKTPKGNKGNGNGTVEDDHGAGNEPGAVLPIDVNFYFFLFWYYGMYLAVALFFITNLFSLYRLNWWPTALGGKLSYGLSWGSTLALGLITHHLDLFHLRERWQAQDPSNDVDWERKTFWVTLSFLAMLMPALACFSKLKKDKRHTVRNAPGGISKTVFGDGLGRRIPASWKRFLWFMSCLGVACFSLIAGQAYASLFLSTLPHTSLDAGTWVWSWVITVQLLATISIYILSSKVRSRALLFLYKLFFQLVYHVFYRNLFARLRSPSQFATVQLLSSISVIIIFPLQMTRMWHRALQIVVGYPQSWEDHVENIATTFYCRGLAQNVTMVGFLGWLSILHFGPNSHIYPFFRFEPTPDDPYTFSLTFLASCAIWGSELVSSFIARQVMSLAFQVNVSQIGMDEMREYPELVPACGWASVHVSMNILLFLIKLNFR